MIRLAKILAIIVFSLNCSFVSAQTGAFGSYSPYSVYGIGDLNKEGGVHNRGMACVGIASRNHRFINFINPAAVSARDTLSFMLDFGISESNKVFKQGGIKSANNTFTVSDFVMSFPIWKSSAFMLGIMPYSNVGYNFSSVEEDKSIIGQTNNISYQSYGQGSLYQVFIGAGATFFKRFSVGAQLMYYFGNIDKVTNAIFEDGAYRSVNSGYTLGLNAFSGKFGLQYQQYFKKDYHIIIGATYKIGSKVKGNLVDYKYAITTELSDSIKYVDYKMKNQGLRFGDELGIGISLNNGQNWSLEFDYTRSNWKKSGFDSFYGLLNRGASGGVFSASVSNSFRAGFEIVPNRDDVRYYFKRCSYRAGIYYEQTHYLVDGHAITSSGMTFGFTLPVFRYYNGLTAAIDVGRRGTVKNNLVREVYVNISVGFNIHDIWFQKSRYR